MDDDIMEGDRGEKDSCHDWAEELDSKASLPSSNDFYIFSTSSRFFCSGRMVQDIKQHGIFSDVGFSDDTDSLQKRDEDEVRKFDSFGDEYKRINLSELDHEALANEESSPLGLTLRKTPSFLELVEKKLSEGSSTKKTESSQSISEKEKLKASNFSASLLRIGNWERVSRYEGDLVGKLYYAKRKLVWEVLNAGLKSKIEIQWSEIVAIRATFRPNQPDVLEVELNHPPSYFQESNPQPRKHTLWHATEDFTGGQAPVSRRHYLLCPEGTLEKHYEKLLQHDTRLYMLSRGPFPAIPSLYFPKRFDGSNYDDFGDYPYSFHQHRSEVCPEFSPVLKVAYSSQYPQFDMRRSSLVLPQQAHSFKPLGPTTIGPMDSNSPCSVVDFQIMEDDRGGSDHFKPQRPFSWPDRLRMTENAINQNGHSVHERFALGSADQFIYSPHQQTPSGFLLAQNGRRMGSSGNNRALTEIEEHLLSDPMASVCTDEQRILDKVDSMYNLLNPAQVNSSFERIGGAYVQTTPSIDSYIPRSSMAIDPSEGISARPISWRPLQDTHENLLTQLSRIDQLPNSITYNPNPNLNYVNDDQNYTWNPWR